MPLEERRGVESDLVPAVSQAAARALLLAAATQETIPGALIDGLIDGILGTPLVRLALEAREPGPQRLMLALRLAAAVCDAHGAWVETKRVEGGAK